MFRKYKTITSLLAPFVLTACETTAIHFSASGNPVSLSAPSNLGELSFENPGSDSVTLNWGAALEPGVSADRLMYKLVTASSLSAVNTLENADQISGQGLLMDWTSGVTSKQVQGLNPNTQYCFAVLVQDRFGNKISYRPQCTSLSASPFPYSMGLYAKSAELQRVEGLIGRKMDHQIAYVNRYGWSSYTSLAGAFGFNSKAASGYKVAISIPTVLDDGYGTDMHSAAMGDYDVYYTQLASNLAPYRSQIVAFHINWEFQAPGFWHGISNKDGSLRWQPADFNGAFQRLASILRRYCPGVPIVWDLNNGVTNHIPAGYAPTDFYPGDEYVDAIGVDLYEQTLGTSGSLFSQALSDNGGLNWIDSFALAHGKKLAIPEWGTDHDDGTFITGMKDWITARISRFVEFTYWDSTDGGVPSSLLSANPAENTAFLNAWQ